jgi:hypothetical protein
MTSQTQSNIQLTQLLLLLFCPVSEVLPSRAKNNIQLGNTFFITSMYLGRHSNQLTLKCIENEFWVSFLIEKVNIFLHFFLSIVTRCDRVASGLGTTNLLPLPLLLLHLTVSEFSAFADILVYCLSCHSCLSTFFIKNFCKLSTFEKISTFAKMCIFAKIYSFAKNYILAKIYTFAE